LPDSPKPKISCRPRIRIKVGDQIALGPGKIDLLEAIAETGSISAAARAIGLSYRRAWDMVDIMNRCFKTPLVEREKGGRGGGGTKLTSLGNSTIKTYRQMEARALKASEPQWQSLKNSLKKP